MSLSGQDIGKSATVQIQSVNDPKITSAVQSLYQPLYDTLEDVIRQKNATDKGDEVCETVFQHIQTCLAKMGDISKSVIAAQAGPSNEKIYGILLSFAFLNASVDHLKKIVPKLEKNKELFSSYDALQIGEIFPLFMTEFGKLAGYVNALKSKLKPEVNKPVVQQPKPVAPQPVQPALRSTTAAQQPPAQPTRPQRPLGDVRVDMINHGSSPAAMFSRPKQRPPQGQQQPQRPHRSIFSSCFGR